MRLQRWVEKRMEALERMPLDGNRGPIAELEIELDYLRQAARYSEQGV